MEQAIKDFKILVVDDIAKNIQVVGNILRNEGYQIAFAQRANDALLLMHESNFDLILLDVMMPEIDGFQLCETLKKDEVFREIPVIFLTAKNDADSIVKGFDVGGVDFISKPFKSTELLARVKTHLSLRYMTKQLQESEQRLNETNQTKDKFFSIIAHDLKNPLAAFRSVSQLLSEAFDEMSRDEIKFFINNINDSTEKLHTLLLDLLEWARSQTGALEYTPIDAELADTVNKIIDVQQISADKKKITIQSDINSDIRLMIDVNMITTVIRNLLSNAIKFTPNDGEIFVSAIVKDKYAEVSIRDTGVGISEENIKKLFRIDVNVTTIGTLEEKGTGLGLILCKEFIDKHSTDIWVESKEGEGATFKFTVPLS